MLRALAHFPRRQGCHSCRQSRGARHCSKPAHIATGGGTAMDLQDDHRARIPSIDARGSCRCSAMSTTCRSLGVSFLVIFRIPFQLVFSDDDVIVVEEACYALSQISRDLDGAKAVIEAGALETVQNLLTSPRAGVRRWASKMLAVFAFHPST
ncbi:hypothetical protein B0H16DRAFT_1003931 [Mycena metata]|uniref:ARM repeat-containing protein n=1 Tax=Mycena metata TaxID=1033252 RepID=A0AAD7K1A4_9AGAR|nr:hypothetical protein B0H16DRAFT_1003931 [Mycena metata]